MRAVATYPGLSSIPRQLPFFTGSKHQQKSINDLNSPYQPECGIAQLGILASLSGPTFNRIAMAWPM
jgi:hypothetical protein